MDNVIIRSERLDDYHAIAMVNAITFDYSFGMGEVPLINVLRNRTTFDPDLSLVAEYRGEVIGHALFTPQSVRVKGDTLQAVILAPIAVHPDFQKLGVGSMLMEEGHQRAMQRGFHLSMLLGHPSYYPRFGYRTRMFGESHIRIQVEDLPASSLSVTERRVERGDVAALCSMWEQMYGDGSLAFMPGDSIMDWISYGSGVRASAVTVDGKLSGYIRYVLKDPQKIIVFLADRHDTAVAILNEMKTRLMPEKQELLLPLYPYSRAVKELVTIPYESEFRAGKASMIKILSDHQAIASYCNEVEAGSLAPGSVIWPVEFEVL
ncbi:GNAT family N-acetyltransferase [Paenibacillus allorhizosphaerae]|uniref:N-acetyltransferase Eis n=1 Tax=Paenibacillus allorhizosphaerae TaxID=2849866 RepID=A0ABN7TKP0_9BACL|nr:N-acetyltransferase [Paenibacillus allorhizosphaerae]CAG7644336.1 N-acetyltransferase Eis [Paenibacillus allorhizosphaerae]